MIEPPSVGRFGPNCRPVTPRVTAGSTRRAAIGRFVPMGGVWGVGDAEQWGLTIGVRGSFSRPACPCRPSASLPPEKLFEGSCGGLRESVLRTELLQ